MLDLSLFRNPTFAGANLAMLLVALAMFGIFFFNSLFIQNVIGWSATQTGATFLPMTVLIVFVAPLAGRVSDRVGSRWLMGVGMTLLTGSLLAFTRLDQSSNFWDVLPGLVLGGIGMSLAMTPTTAAAMGSVPVDKAGVGSAILNCSARSAARWDRGDGRGRRLAGQPRATSGGLRAGVRLRLSPRAPRRRRHDPRRRRSPSPPCARSPITPSPAGRWKPSAPERAEDLTRKAPGCGSGALPLGGSPSAMRVGSATLRPSRRFLCRPPLSWRAPCKPEPGVRPGCKVA